MFVVGNVVIDEDIPHATFCCDVPRCRGACCMVAGGRGAPLVDQELQEIATAFRRVKPYLSQNALRTIEKEGLYEGKAGDFATTCVDGHECVFAYFEGGIARCSFDRAFGEGKITWRKPLSCHLYPLRVRKNGTDLLQYHQIEECQAGRERGKKQKTILRTFLQEPLVRAYGEEWYDKFTVLCDSIVV